MRIAVSACLLGENCKYNGGNNLRPELVELLLGREVVAVCPEVLGGLATPRVPAEIVQARSATVRVRASTRRLGAAPRRRGHACRRQEAAILRCFSRGAPSCGVGVVYDGTFSGTLVPGDGIFAALLRDHGIPCVSADDPSTSRAAD